MLHGNADGRKPLLLVFLKNQDCLRIISDWLWNHLRGILRNFHALPQLFYVCLYMVDVHVTDHDDGLIIWTIPFLVIVAQSLVREIVDNLHKTNWQAMTVFRTWIQAWKYFLIHALTWSLVELPLLMDHTTLLVDFLTSKRKTV